jgi:hypothetical protein
MQPCDQRKAPHEAGQWEDRKGQETEGSRAGRPTGPKHHQKKREAPRKLTTTWNSISMPGLIVLTSTAAETATARVSLLSVALEVARPARSPALLAFCRLGAIGEAHQAPQGARLAFCRHNDRLGTGRLRLHFSIRSGRGLAVGGYGGEAHLFPCSVGAPGKRRQSDITPI